MKETNDSDKLHYLCFLALIQACIIDNISSQICVEIPEVGINKIKKHKEAFNSWSDMMYCPYGGRNEIQNG